MATLYIDCCSGISGDMMLGAFLDLGVPAHVLTDGLARLKLGGFRLVITKQNRGGIRCTDVDVVLSDTENMRRHPYSGKYRNYGEIRAMIASSALSETVKAVSRRIFDIKAKAESSVHGVPLDAVQFHEAGAVDSIVDIVGAAICYDHFGIRHVVSCHVPTGYGTVRCACGELPVPAPAVRGILKDTGIPYYTSDVEQELLTPTGAAILAGITNEFQPHLKLPERCSRQGCGSGKRDTGLPPLRLYLIETAT